MKLNLNFSKLMRVFTKISCEEMFAPEINNNYLTEY